MWSISAKGCAIASVCARVLPWRRTSLPGTCLVGWPRSSAWSRAATVVRGSRCGLVWRPRRWVPRPHPSATSSYQPRILKRPDHLENYLVHGLRLDHRRAPRCRRPRLRSRRRTCSARRAGQGAACVTSEASITPRDHSNRRLTRRVDREAFVDAHKRIAGNEPWLHLRPHAIWKARRKLLVPLRL